MRRLLKGVRNPSVAADCPRPASSHQCGTLGSGSFLGPRFPHLPPPPPPTAGPAPSGGSDFQRLLPPLGLDADLSVQQRPASCPVSLKVILFAGVRGPFRLSKAGPSGPSIRESDCPAGRGRNGAEAGRPRRAHLSELPPALGAAGATPFHAARKAM